MLISSVLFCSALICLIPFPAAYSEDVDRGDGVVKAKQSKAKQSRAEQSRAEGLFARVTRQDGTGLS